MLYVLLVHQAIDTAKNRGPRFGRDWRSRRGAQSPMSPSTRLEWSLLIVKRMRSLRRRGECRVVAAGSQSLFRASARSITLLKRSKSEWEVKVSSSRNEPSFRRKRSSRQVLASVRRDLRERVRETTGPGILDCSLRTAKYCSWIARELERRWASASATKDSEWRGKRPRFFKSQRFRRFGWNNDLAL